MNPKRRHLSRQAGGRTLRDVQHWGRQIIRAMLLADAMAVACLRTETGPAPKPNLADGRLLWALRETTRYMNMELIDYFVARLGSLDYHSWREHERPRRLTALRPAAPGAFSGHRLPTLAAIYRTTPVFQFRRPLHWQMHTRYGNVTE